MAIEKEELNKDELVILMSYAYLTFERKGKLDSLFTLEELKILDIMTDEYLKGKSREDLDSNSLKIANKIKKSLFSNAK